MGLSIVEIVVVILYAVGIFALAHWVSRTRCGEQKDAADHFLASRATENVQ